MCGAFDTIEISQEGPDRTKITGVKGEPPPRRPNVCINNAGNYRNSMTIVLTGLDIEKKAEESSRRIGSTVLGGRGNCRGECQLIRSDKEDPQE